MQTDPYSRAAKEEMPEDIFGKLGDILQHPPTINQDSPYDSIQAFEREFDLTPKHRHIHKLTYSVDTDKSHDCYKAARLLMKKLNIIDLDAYTQTWNGTVNGEYTSIRTELVIEHKFFSPNH